MKKILLLLLLLNISIGVYGQNVFYAAGSSDKKQIALTFDDGPGKSTENILRILKDKDVKATFFILGTSLHNNRKQYLKDAYDAGHEIANHTFNHVNFYKYKDNDIKSKITEELLTAEQAVEKITGYKTKLVRYPHGYAKDIAKQVAKENGYTVINWSFGCDWHKMPEEQMYNQYKQAIKPGAILLMHDLGKNEKVAAFLPKLIDDIKQSGYEIVTVGTLLDIK